MSAPSLAAFLSRPGSQIIVRTLVVLVVSCAAARGDDAENHGKLEAMPLERRAALAENLARFDRLDDRDRAAVRRLDRELARRDPIDEARFRSLMRRYHLWASGLPEDQRQALRAATTPEARHALVRQILQKQGASEPVGSRISGLRVGQFGLVGPYEMAFLLQVWNKLSPEKKQAVANLRGAKLVSAIRAEAGRVKVAFQPFPANLDRVYEAKLESDPTLKGLIGGHGKNPDAARKSEDAAAKPPEKAPRRSEHPYAEFLYFEDPEHRPQPVAPNHLALFQATCPPWLLEMLDPLSPDDARAYLTILYRLLYPHPTEMPEKAATPSTNKPEPRVAPKPPSGAAVPL